MLHYRGCAKTRTEKGLDILLFIFGAAACIFCTVQTARLLVSRTHVVRKWPRLCQTEPSAPPKLGKCQMP
jgi:proton-coupled amino acid transporter